MALMKMTKRTSLLLLVPLGAGLLYLGNLASDKPGVAGRPATLPAMPRVEQATGQELDVAAKVASVEYAPARTGLLETVLEQGTVGERKAAIRELRHLASYEAIAVLSLSLGDEDRRVRKAALEALSSIGGDEALAAIASATKERDPLLRAQAAEALANAGGYSASNYLELALRDEDARVRMAAISALGDLNDSRSVNIISLALRDPDPEVRERAAEMLDELNDEALFSALYPAL